MTRNNGKRNHRRERRHNAQKSAFFGGILDSILNEMEEIATKKRKGNLYSSCHVGIPTNGTAVELPIPDGTEVFISEEGKPMIRAKVANSNDTDEFDKICIALLAKNRSSVGTFSCTAISNDQKRQLEATQKLQLIAKHLNKGWVPNDKCDSWYIIKSKINEMYFPINFNTFRLHGAIAFKTEELAKRAIEIMGKCSLDELFKDNI